MLADRDDRLPNESLAAEVEVRMHAQRQPGDSYGWLTVASAVAVAVEMIEREREAKRYNYLEADKVPKLLQEIVDLTKRAEAAEKERDEARKALAERGHVANCGCGCGITDCEEGHNSEHDPRCARAKGGTEP